MIARKIARNAAVAGILWFCAGSGPAAAQGGLIVKGGLGMPLASTPDTVEPYFGGEYEFAPGQLEIFRGTVTSFSADWLQVSTRRPGRVVESNYFPVMLNLKWFSDPETVRQPLYFGVGFGIGLASRRIPEQGHSSGANFAWQAMVGQQFQPNWRIEARYLAGSDPRRDGVIGIQLGHTFR